MSLSSILAQLSELQPDSDTRLRRSVIDGATRSFTRARSELIRSRPNPDGAGAIFVPTNGWDSVADNLQSRRKLMTLPPGAEDNFTRSLNDALQGGDSYPILNAVLGTAVGVASGGAGLLFTIATTAIDVARVAQRVLARGGDELWQVEEIGKARDDSWFSDGGMRPVHVGSYFLIDPYRQNSGYHNKGWLIHEERTMLDV